ncbi:MAG TPA: hypothetical protein VNW15_03185 [Rhizomicrobium sp.]|jgi:hypothetical protein|nr:hypothetical protein [Rhizomicrobium sp.]
MWLSKIVGISATVAFMGFGEAASDPLTGFRGDLTDIAASRQIVDFKELARVKETLSKGAALTLGSADAVEAQMRDQIKDPKLEFHDIRTVSRDGLTFLCGEVRTKNSFNRYVDQGFIASGDGVVARSGDLASPYALALTNAGIDPQLMGANFAVVRLCS